MHNITLKRINAMKRKINKFIEQHGFTQYDELLRMSQKLDRLLNQYAIEKGEIPNPTENKTAM